MKDLSAIKQIIKELKPELEKKFHVSSIGIFGSVVRNDFFSIENEIIYVKH
jgi:predicted nucleotidyltransferase